MPLKYSNLFGGYAVPKPNGLVIRRRSNSVSIGAEGNASYTIFMPLKYSNLFGGCAVPKPDDRVIRTRSNVFAIWAESDRSDVVVEAGFDFGILP